MKPSPIGSKLLSVYGAIFAGLAPLTLACIGLFHGMGLLLVYNVLLAATIVYFAVRVFLGDARAVYPFATLVMLHYFGVTLSNLVNQGNFPDGSRAAQMAVPRMIRGVLFGGVYAWYYLLRPKTRQGFQH